MSSPQICIIRFRLILSPTFSYFTCKCLNTVKDTAISHFYSFPRHLVSIRVSSYSSHSFYGAEMESVELSCSSLDEFRSPKEISMKFFWPSWLSYMATSRLTTCVAKFLSIVDVMWSCSGYGMHCLYFKLGLVDFASLN